MTTDTKHPPGLWRLADTNCPDSLRSWLTWVGILDCPCAFEWLSLGVLHGVSEGKGWVRITTESECPQHGEAAPLPKPPVTPAVRHAQAEETP